MTSVKGPFIDFCTAGTFGDISVEYHLIDTISRGQRKLEMPHPRKDDILKRTQYRPTGMKPVHEGLNYNKRSKRSLEFGGFD